MTDTQRELFNKHFFSRAKIYEEKFYTPMKIANEAFEAGWQAALAHSQQDAQTIANLQQALRLLLQILDPKIYSEHRDLLQEIEAKLPPITNREE